VDIFTKLTVTWILVGSILAVIGATVFDSMKPGLIWISGIMIIFLYLIWIVV
jgi:hypothetical protein